MSTRVKLLMLFWLQDHNEKITRNDIHAVDKSLFNDGIPFKATTLSELYLQFNIFVNGYLDLNGYGE